MSRRHLVSFNVTEQEFRKIAKAARKHYSSLAAFCRRAVMLEATGSEGRNPCKGARGKAQKQPAPVMGKGEGDE